MKELENDY